MAVPKNPEIPSFLIHKRSGNGRIKIDGQELWLGPADSPAARERYRDHVWPPQSIVRSQVGGAARNLQNYCHRQAFNFRIQSLGAAYIKMLQARIARDQIGRGVHTAADMPILPGINVHDELHFHARDVTAVQSVQSSTTAFVSGISQQVGVPIVFEFSEVKSWADKA